MTQGEIRFTLITFVVAVTSGLIMAIFEGSISSFEHFLLKFGYLVPALLLNIDMWAQYNRYYENRDAYKHRDLFFDVLILALSYIALATLKAIPSGTGAEAFRTYPPQSCWIALIVYSLLKTYRAWPIYRSGADNTLRISWMSLLHVALLVLILSAWGWQQDFLMQVPVPFAWSGVIFTVVAALYLFAVYKLRWDPLTPMGVFRRWSE
jgi:hypothetical protein